MSVSEDHSYSIIRAYKLYESLSSDKRGEVDVDKSTKVYLAKEKGELVFVKKSSLAGRIKSVFGYKDLDYEKNIQEINNLFKSINLADKDQLKKATDTLRKSNESLSSDDVVETINKLQKLLLEQKAYIGKSSRHKNINISDLSVTPFSAIRSEEMRKKTEKINERAKSFWAESIEFRDGRVKAKLRANPRLFNKEFSEVQIGCIPKKWVNHAASFRYICEAIFLRSVHRFAL